MRFWFEKGAGTGGSGICFIVKRIMGGPEVSGNWHSTCRFDCIVIEYLDAVK